MFKGKYTWHVSKMKPDSDSHVTVQTMQSQLQGKGKCTAKTAKENKVVLIQKYYKKLQPNTLKD